MATGVDWKSITYPACLPITTDYRPDERTLHTDYVISQYNLTPVEFTAADTQTRSPVPQRAPLSTREVFLELISQRLAQNFQRIVAPKGHWLDPGTVMLNLCPNSWIVVGSSTSARLDGSR
jgi:hypothetical protein